MWSYYTLDEGSLEHYIASLLQDAKSLKSHYLDKSLLRDPLLSQRLISTISNLRAIAAQMVSKTSFNCIILIFLNVDKKPKIMNLNFGIFFLWWSQKLLATNLLVCIQMKISN